MSKKESPSMDAWLNEAKKHKSAEKIGMYLTHNGIVRKSAKASVRYGEANTKALCRHRLCLLRILPHHPLSSLQ